MVAERPDTLRDWGRRRERRLHRTPRCLMDQLISGSGYYPVRLLEERWFTQREKNMVAQLETLLQCTGHATDFPEAPQGKGEEACMRLDMLRAAPHVLQTGAGPQEENDT